MILIVDDTGKVAGLALPMKQMPKRAKAAGLSARARIGFRGYIPVYRERINYQLYAVYGEKMTPMGELAP